MPRSFNLRREVSSLTISGGYSGRKAPIGYSDSNWIFDVCHSASLVTRAQMEDKDQETLLSLDSENDSISSTDPDIPCVAKSGNRLIHLPSLISTVQQFTTCRACSTDMMELLFESFLSYCEGKVDFDIRKLHKEWKNRLGSEWQNYINVTDVTYGLAAELQFVCSRCHVISTVTQDSRGWKNHSATVTAKKRLNQRVRSELCSYDMNVKYFTALQLMGVRGEHAAIMAAFLDLPHPHKWP